MNGPRPDSDSVTDYLQTDDAHQRWISHYRGPENERFYELALDHAIKTMKLGHGDTIHDFGCGSAQHSIRFARRGLDVRAFDFSVSALDLAAAAVEKAGLSDRISLAQGDLTKLSLADGSVRFGLCWGVLMHIPEVETAIAELSRVMSPGAVLLVSEGNTSAPLSALIRHARVLLKKGVQPRRVPAGFEYWTREATGALVTRQSDVGWLRRTFAAHGMQLYCRHSGQFTELYTRFDGARLRKAIHSFNRAWFRLDPLPAWSGANMLYFRKTENP
jgi:2-polyprenyl-3-methyl-5-hydroxy-6-metoxy-1,4-benzoquinol methylase